MTTFLENHSEFVLLLLLLIAVGACSDAPKEMNKGVSSETNSFSSYNHTAFVVKNLDESIEFYHYVFEFDTIHYPFPYRENIKAKWMSMGHNAELHLGEFKGDTTEYYYPGHMGLTVKSLDTIFSRLANLGYQLPEMEEMPNGERTVHIQDVDGNNIHLIERK